MDVLRQDTTKFGKFAKNLHYHRTQGNQLFIALSGTLCYEFLERNKSVNELIILNTVLYCVFLPIIGGNQNFASTCKTKNFR